MDLQEGLRTRLEAFDPKSNALPFVYDAFRWDHCEARGVFLGRDR